MITNLPVNGDAAANGEAVATALGEHPLLIDHYLPRFDVALLAHEVAEADRPTTWQALREFDLMRVRSPLLSSMFATPAASERAPRPAGGQPSPRMPQRLTFEAGLPGWVRLGEAPQQELCVGAVGVFWDGVVRWEDVSESEFESFDEPGYGKVAVSLTVRSCGHRQSMVSYECRTAITDATSRQRFRHYWTAMRPLVGHLMRETVSTVARDAEERQAEAPQPGER